MSDLYMKPALGRKVWRVVHTEDSTIISFGDERDNVDVVIPGKKDLRVLGHFFVSYTVVHNGSYVLTFLGGSLERKIVVTKRELNDW